MLIYSEILELGDKYGLPRLISLCELYISKEVERATTDGIEKAGIFTVVDCVRACARADCVRACARADCVRACARADCVRACARARVCVCANKTLHLA